MNRSKAGARSWAARGVGLMLGTLGVPACAPASVVLDVPFTEADVSVVLGVERAGRLEVFAAEELGRRRAVAAFDRTEDEPPTRVTALLYPDPLAVLELEPGPVRLAEARARSRPWPASPRVIVELEVRGPDDRWREVPAPRGLFGQARPEDPRAPRCSMHTPRVFELEPPDDPAQEAPSGLGRPGSFAPGPRGREASLVPDGEGAILVVPDSGPLGPVFYRLDPNGARVEPRRAELAGFTLTAQTRARDERLRLFGAIGGRPAAWVGSIARGFLRLEAGRDVIVRAVPGTIEDDPATVYALTARGHLLRLDARGFTLLDDSSARLGNSGALAVVSAREVFFSPGPGAGIFRWSPEGTTAEPTEIDGELERSSDRVHVLTSAPGMGVFAGTVEGTLLERTADGWRVITRLPFAEQTIHALTPSDGALWVGARYGMVYETRSGHLCPEPTPLGSNITVLDLSPTPRGLLIAGRRGLDGEDELIAGAVSFGTAPSVP